MISEVIWTSGATQDFLEAKGEAQSAVAFTLALDSAIDLIRSMPEYGSPVRQARYLRRILLGKRRQFGLYYRVHGSRVVVAALLDLRQSPEKVVEILRSRGLSID